MTDDQNPTPDENDEEMIEIDGDHPWVQAALMAHPRPVPTSVSIEPVDIPNEENPDKPRKAALLNVVDITGVKTVFLPPNVLVGLMQQGAAIFEYWDEKDANKGGIIIANKSMEAAARAQADSAAQAAQLFRGGK